MNMPPAILKNAYKPFIVGIGGTTRAGSTTNSALMLALRAAEEAGARALFFDGAFLSKLPIYDPGNTERSPEQRQLIDAVRSSDGLIVGSPGYHGGVSGLVKNALDHLEDLGSDKRRYLDGRAVGCIITASGWQAAGTSLTALRSIVHALRAWPTPFGATLNTSIEIFDAKGECADEKVAVQLSIVGHQVVEFALNYHRREVP